MRTVQRELESALKKLFQTRVKVAYASRTDSGVHAEAQVANFLIDSKIPPVKILLGLNHYLPEDFSVTQAEEVTLNFHAQFSARWKTYEYRVLSDWARHPTHRFRSFQVFKPLNLRAMQDAARLLKGTHDFRAFQASGSERKTTVRTIRRFKVSKNGKMIVFAVEANGFLYKMVRSLVGTLVKVGEGRLSLSELALILRKQNRALIGETLPAHGLTLKKVTY